MRRRLPGLLLALLAAVTVAPLPAQQTALPTAVRETVGTPDGTVQQFYRDTVLPSDLDLPIWETGQRQNGGVYRLRDRKNRDLLRFARLDLLVHEPIETLATFYLAKLGPEAQRTSDKETGEVFLFAGTRDNNRLVTLTPEAQGVRLRLERVERFTIPPRVYTAREEQTLRVLEEVAATYRTATQVRYTMEQQVESDDMEEAHPPVVRWTVAFTRPSTLTVLAKVGVQTGFSIVTDGKQLKVVSGTQEPDLRAIGEGITSALVPELDSDPAARLMLADPLLSPDVDYLGLQPVTGVPLAQQVDVVLTYPDQELTLRLRLDRVQHTLIRAEVITRHDGHTQRVIRTYRDVVLTPPVPPTPPPTPPPATTAVPR